MKLFHLVLSCVFLMPAFVRARDETPQGERGHQFSAGGGEKERYSLSVSSNVLDQTPKWSVTEGEEVPLSTAKAVAIANRELSSYVTEASAYHVTQVILRRFYDSDWWYYTVTYRPRTANSEVFSPPFTPAELKRRAENVPIVRIVVLMSGKAMKGQSF